MYKQLNDDWFKDFVFGGNNALLKIEAVEKWSTKDLDRIRSRVTRASPTCRSGGTSLRAGKMRMGTNREEARGEEVLALHYAFRWFL